MVQVRNRVGEMGLLPFRTGRVFNIGLDWFFAVRDEKYCGPFENMQLAQSELNLFLNNIE